MFVTDEAEHPFKTLMWESAQRSWIYSLLETDEAPSFIFLLTLCLYTFGDDASLFRHDDYGAQFNLRFSTDSLCKCN
jgi:hypothetical protein